eukprot:scaffold7095_cov260-Pinguiococcus_pyrenoidosus.AAC.22
MAGGPVIHRKSLLCFGRSDQALFCPLAPQNGFVGRDGCVYGIPLRATGVLRIEPSTGKVSRGARELVDAHALLGCATIATLSTWVALLRRPWWATCRARTSTKGASLAGMAFCMRCRFERSK